MTVSASPILWTIPESPKPHGPVFAEYSLTNSHAKYMIRDGNLKYTFWTHDTPELYDLSADPEELHNLANNKAHSQDVERLRQGTVHMASTCPSLMVANMLAGSRQPAHQACEGARLNPKECLEERGRTVTQANSNEQLSGMPAIAGFSCYSASTIARIAIQVAGTSARILRAQLCLMFFIFVMHASASAGTPIAERGGYFTTSRDIRRMRTQAGDPLLQEIYTRTKDGAEQTVANWEKSFPPQSTARTTRELLTAGRSQGRPHDGNYVTLAIQAALDPSEQNKRTLREMMIYNIGIRQRSHNWAGQGIHEGIAVIEFLQSYDIGAQLRVFTPEDHAAIRDEMHQAGHFFEGWAPG